MFEVNHWRKPGLVLSIPTAALSQRAAHSTEINSTYGEGGGLNADYTTVEAIAIASNMLGEIGLKYGTDFVFKTGGSRKIDFDFKDDDTREKACRVLPQTVSKVA